MRSTKKIDNKKYSENTISPVGLEFMDFVGSIAVNSMIRCGVGWYPGIGQPGRYIQKYAPDGRFKDLKSDDIKDIRLFK